MADEEVLFEKGNVKVTTIRANLYGTMYPISALTSVRTISRSGSVLPIALGLILGCLAVFFLFLAWQMSEPASGIGAFSCLLVGVGLAVAGRPTTTYLVVVSTAGGDRNAMTTKDRGLAAEVREAIETAIVRRG